MTANVVVPVGPDTGAVGWVVTLNMDASGPSMLRARPERFEFPVFALHHEPPTDVKVGGRMGNRHLGD